MMTPAGAASVVVDMVTHLVVSFCNGRHSSIHLHHTRNVFDTIYQKALEATLPGNNNNNCKRFPRSI